MTFKVFTLTLISLTILCTLQFPPSHAKPAVKANSITQRLGIEITTDTNDKPLYVPVALSNEKSITAYVPVRNGNHVSAVRIEPVMDNGKVKFTSAAISGDYQSNKSCADVKTLPSTLIGSHYLDNGETISVRDNLSTSPWSVKIKAVNLRSPIKLGQKPNVANVHAFQDPIEELESAGPCGCASCGRKDPLLCCPARGKCMECSDCGTVCCPNG